jgi:hypothetical protein
MKRHSEYKKKGIVPEYDLDYTNALTLMKRVKVKIPFADLIDKHFPSGKIVMRTNYPRFLDYICASTAFHQFQRKRDDDGFVLAEKQDYEIARACFLKLFSNQQMIPLTTNQRRILEYFESTIDLKGSVTSLHSTMNFISERALQTNLQNLVKYGFLTIKTEKDSWNRDIEVYLISDKYKPNEKLNIPSFEEITKINSTPSEATTPSKLSIPSVRCIKTIQC